MECSLCPKEYESKDFPQGEEWKAEFTKCPTCYEEEWEKDKADAKSFAEI